MLCCTVIGLFLAQCVAFLGIVKVDRASGSILHLRERISGVPLLAMSIGTLAAIVLAAFLYFQLSVGKSALPALGRLHICSVLGISSRQVDAQRQRAIRGHDNR